MLKTSKKGGISAAAKAGAEIDTELKEKAMQQVAELGKIRRKLEKYKRLTEEEYDTLVEYTDADKATVNPRGDAVPERRHKIVMTLQTIWTNVVQDNKEFSYEDETFDEILDIIKRLVKTKKDGYKDSEDTFRILLLADK